MLEELRLRGLGVLEDAVLELGPGFTVITGETGAGKTMLLTGLGLLLGARGDAGLVRAGHDRAEADARWVLDLAHPAVERVLEAGGSLDDDTLILSRTLASEGRSRAFAGGRSVPVALLSEVAETLVAVHGQADQRGLLRPSVQRSTLDRFAGPEPAVTLGRYRDCFARLASVRAELHDVTARRRERAQEADLLRLGLAEIAAVDPVSGEDVALRAELSRLGHVDLLRRAAEVAHAALSAPDGGAAGATAGSAAGGPETDVLSLVAAARRSLEEARGADPTLDTLAERLAEVSYLASDLSADLAAYFEAVEADPHRLEVVQQRLASLTTLTRKYAPDVDGVVAWAEQARKRLAELDDDGRVERLTAEHEQLTTELAQEAVRLSAMRASAAARLSTAVDEELAGLAMAQAHLRVEVGQRPDEHGLRLPDGRHVAFGPQGIDEVELLLVAHPAAPPRPLHKGASGGELSRIMLAIEVVLAGADTVPTFVFDEIDAGVGGRAAVEVGRRLAALAGTAQVLVVTHLPQVAAFADRHLVVHRTSDDPADPQYMATTDVRRVEGEERLAELSRMLSGMSESQLGRDHAEELLAVASAAKSGR
jgi:DNA repair protein RecN (Recombination protein N)